MRQTEARRRAVELSGVATHAYQCDDGSWRVGGWPHQRGMTWIVISCDGTRVLDDSRTTDDETTDRRRRHLIE